MRRAPASRAEVGWRRLRGRLALWGVSELGLVLAFWALMSVPLLFLGWGAWSLLSLPIFIGVVAAAGFVVTATLHPIARLAAKRPHVLRYFECDGAATTQGTLSLIDGVAHSSWTLNPGEGPEQFAEGPVDAATFRALWASARTLRALKAYAVGRAADAPDFEHDVVLGFETVLDGERIVKTFWIPRDRMPARVAELLARIRAALPPHGDLAPGPANSSSFRRRR